MLTIELNHPNKKYTPGDVLVATVQWSFEKAPRWLELSLGWETEGKGTTDADTVAKQRWEEPGISGNLEWKQPVPRGPLSLQGTLISIRWHLTCELHGGDEVTVPFVVSHFGAPVRLDRIPS